MRDAQRARRQLSGQWPAAVAAECALLAAQGVLLLLELLVLRLSGLSAERVVHAEDVWQGAWPYALLLLGSLLLNWLLLSPLRLGRAAYYWKLSAGEETSLSLLTAYYRTKTADTVSLPHPWRTSLRWQWGLWWRRLVYGLACFAPAALALGYADVVRRSGSDTMTADIQLLVAWVAAIVLLGAGFVLLELTMLSYLPSTYLVIEGVPLNENPFGRSSRLMRGQIGAACWLYLGFAGWFASCALLLPYLYAAPLFQTTRCLAVRRFLCTGNLEKAAVSRRQRRRPAQRTTTATARENARL